jgi:hypothetical protein
VKQRKYQVSGGTSETPFQKRAYEYSTNHYFIDTLYASKTQTFFIIIMVQATPEYNSEFKVVDIEVWKSVIG